MIIKLHPPCTKQTFESFVKQCADSINRHECGSILNLAKRDQIYRIKQLQENPATLKRFIKDFQNTQLVFLDLSSSIIEDVIDLDAFLNKNLLPDKKYHALFILDSDRLLEERVNLLSHFNSFYHQKKNLSFIYLFQKNITLPRFTRRFSRYSTLYQNIHIFPLFEKKDTKEFMIQLEQRFQSKIPKDVAERILDQCGGYLWLIKQTARHYSQTKDVSRLFDHDGINLRLEIIWNEFTSEEKTVLEKIVKKDFAFSSLDGQIVEYFVKTKLFKKNRFQYCFTVPILERFIRSQLTEKNSIRVNSKGQITINTLIINSFFSKRERRFITYFITHRNTLVSREKAAELIWPNESYSDWALDQAIKRLRRKFESLGLPKDLIRTKKNQGFIFL